MPTITPDRAQHLKDLATRLFARSRGMKDPFTGNLQGPPAIAGMLKEAAGVLAESGYPELATKVSSDADQVFGSWQKGESYGQYRTSLKRITWALMNAGVTPNQYGWMTGDMRVSMDGATPDALPGGVRNPSTGSVGGGRLPTFPVAPQPGPPQIMESTSVNDMDPLTGIEDPLAEPANGNIRYNWWDDVKSGAGWAWRNVGQPLLGGGAGQPQGGGMNPPVVPPMPGGGTLQPPSDPRWWQQQGEKFRDALLGGNGNGNGGGDGPDFPLPFPIDLARWGYGQAFGGNGQMPDVGSLMLPAVTAPAATARLKAPKGYVIVTIQQNDPLYATAAQAGGVQQPDGSIKVAMDKDKARKRKYWKPRPKPWLTAADRRVLTKANRVEKKVAKAYLKAGIGPKDIKEAKNC